MTMFCKIMTSVRENVNLLSDPMSPNILEAIFGYVLEKRRVRLVSLHLSRLTQFVFFFSFHPKSEMGEVIFCISLGFINKAAAL